eukprot:1157203-Pelagomonas_calceolata.AAC.8
MKGLRSAIHGAPHCSRVLLRGRDPFSAWAAPKLKDLELLSMDVAAAESMGGAGQLRACKGELPVKGGPEAGEGTRSLLLKPGGQGQGAWVRRLSELMRRFLRTPQMK